MAVIWIDRPFPELDAIVQARNQHEVVGPDDARRADAAAVIVGGAQWGAAMMDEVPRLRVLARTGIGVDAVDLDEATRRGIAVTNTPDGPTVSTAEHTIALMFAAAKTLPAHQARLRRHDGGYALASTGLEFDGRTLGLLGFGRIARRVARIASAVGMNVLAHDPFLSEAGEAELVGFDVLTERADVLSLHAPLTTETERLFDADVFARCKPGVVFVNCARGGLVDHDALVDALRSGQVAAAGLDVTDPEPLPTDHPLLAMENVIVTPHIASSTVVGRERMLTQAVEQVLIGLDGMTPTNTVNPVNLE